MNNFALSGRLPDLTIFIAGDAEYFLRRAWELIDKTSDTQTRFEQEALEFHRKIVDGIYELAPTNKRYSIVEDNEGDSIETINKRIMRVINSHL